MHEQASPYHYEKIRKAQTDPGPATNAAGLPDGSPAWQYAPYEDHGFVVLLTGSAGGGKSRLAGEMVNRFMAAHPGAAGLVMRKAREWTGKSIVPFLKQTVIKQQAEYKKSDMWFEYLNGSLLYVGGMKDDGQREAVRSIGGDGGLDIVWFEEANAFTEEDFNEIIGRMRGKAGPYRQIILTTNPDAPSHWINQRLIIGGEASVYYSGAKDNPFNPPEYLQRLELMTGTQYKRLVLGQWILAEGAVYDNFSTEPDGNVTTDAEYNPNLPVFWGYDDGYAYGQGPGTFSYHPRVILLANMTPMGGFNVFYERYQCLEPSYNVSIQAVIEQGYAEPDSAYGDSSAPAFADVLWNDFGIYATGMTHPVQDGIKNLRDMVCDGHNIRRIKIHPRCVNLIRELQSYRYADSKIAIAGENKPEKVDDHGPDCLRYLCWTLRNERLT